MENQNKNNLRLVVGSLSEITVRDELSPTDRCAGPKCVIFSSLLTWFNPAFRMKNKTLMPSQDFQNNNLYQPWMTSIKYSDLRRRVSTLTTHTSIRIPTTANRQHCFVCSTNNHWLESFLRSSYTTLESLLVTKYSKHPNTTHIHIDDQKCFEKVLKGAFEYYYA